MLNNIKILNNIKLLYAENKDIQRMIWCKNLQEDSEV